MPLPRVVIHNEVSVDGRIDWFKVHEGLYYSLVSTWGNPSTLSGIETLFDPRVGVPKEEKTPPGEPVVDPKDERPLLVVTDSRGRGHNWQFFREWPYFRDIVILVSEKTPASYLKYLEDRYMKYIAAGEDKVDLRKALLELNAKFGVETVRTDSGGTLNGALLRAGLVNEISLMVSPSLVGGVSPKSFFRAPDLESPRGVIELELFHVEKLEEGVVWLRYKVR